VRTRIILFAAALVGFVSIAQTGCASKPVDELQIVRTAMEEAQSKEASIYAPNDWDRGRWQWEMANSLIVMGRYSEAEQILVLSAGSFNTARDLASSRLEAIIQEVTILQADIKTVLNDLTQLGDKPGTGPSVKQKIKATLPHVEERIAAMQAAVEYKDYLAARRDGSEVLHALTNLRESLKYVK
jgi:hypothetical protein